jgi:hypothetical protein
METRVERGKAIHPENWGQFEQDPDMDVELQEAALAAYRKRGKTFKEKEKGQKY